SNHFMFVVFQAKDGIRDFHVTGVQTCAFPISVCSPRTYAEGSAAYRASISAKRESSSVQASGKASKYRKATWHSTATTIVIRRRTATPSQTFSDRRTNWGNMRVLTSSSRDLQHPPR